jgi:hypothetical protein
VTVGSQRQIAAIFGDRKNATNEEQRSGRRPIPDVKAFGNASLRMFLRPFALSHELVIESKLQFLSGRIDHIVWPTSLYDSLN